MTVQNATEGVAAAIDPTAASGRMIGESWNR